MPILHRRIKNLNIFIGLGLRYPSANRLLGGEIYDFEIKYLFLFLIKYYICVRNNLLVKLKN